MTAPFPDEFSVMRHAIELARRGLGAVEPNPPVGAVIVDDALQPLGEGYHQQFGGPHAEVHALRQAGDTARGATLFVTLEPCSHHGKTPPCTEAVIAAGLRRVVVAVIDPAPHASGGGIEQLRRAGIVVETGMLEREGELLAAPFFKRIATGRPFVHAKWAMTLDGKLAARGGHSQWISSADSRARVHALRGRMDAILVGVTTALQDNPLLTARPAGSRIANRIVLDRELALPRESRLLTTIAEAPVLIATSVETARARGATYRKAGAELIELPCRDDDPRRLDLSVLLDQLGEREMSNLLVEGGGGILGDLFDHGLIDACHVFVAPKLVGGVRAATPLGGLGLEHIPPQSQFRSQQFELIGEDMYFQGILDSAWWHQSDR